MRRNSKRCGHCRRKPENPLKALCNACHAAYMREWRKTHRLEGEARLRANARAYLHVYEKRGKVKREPCANCGEPEVEPHHLDYRRPLEVIWLCRRCHLAEDGAILRVYVSRRAANVC